MRAKLLGAMAVVLALAATMPAFAGWFGFGSTSWKEEVLLHDGTKIIVERSVERGGLHEIGQEPPIKEQRLTFTLPRNNEEVVWYDNAKEDVGSANFLPMMLEVLNGTTYLVAHPMGCLSYNKWGRPNPPYVVFKYENKQWDRISLLELPNELKSPNLIFSSPDHVAEKAGGSIVSSQAIRALYEGYKQPEYKTILREPLPQARIIELCGDVVLYRGHWILRNSDLDKLRIDRMLAN